MKSRIKIIPGGSSAGKTFGILPILIDKCIKTPNLSVSVVSESMPHLRKGAIRDFINIMKYTNRWIPTHYNKTNSIYTFGNGSYIEFFAADSADKLRGARRDILYVNECNNITGEAYTQLAMRTNKDIYLDYNPSHSFWIEDVKKSEESETLILTYKDNEALSKSVINFLEQKRELAKTSDYWKNWVRVYLDGLDGKLDGVIFDNYKIIDNLPKDDKGNLECSIIGAGMDFGFTNDPTTLISVYKWNNAIILDELIYETGLLNQQIAKRIKSFNLDCEIYADSAEPKSIKEIRNQGIKIYPAKKGKDSINYGIQLLQEKEIYITKRSVNLINEFNKYSWKKDKNGNSLNTPIDDYNHGLDALRYIAISKFGKNATFYNQIVSKPPTSIFRH